LKPNLTPAERQTIENGFRAVGSQQVTLTIESIDRQGPEAFVRLRRHDVVEMNGRRRTVDNEQTLRLLRSPAGWVIVRIGR